MLKKEEYDHIMKLNQFHDNENQRQKQLNQRYKISLAS